MLYQEGPQECIQCTLGLNKLAAPYETEETRKNHSRMHFHFITLNASRGPWLYQVSQENADSESQPCVAHINKLYCYVQRNYNTGDLNTNVTPSKQEGGNNFVLSNNLVTITSKENFSFISKENFYF